MSDWLQDISDRWSGSKVETPKSSDGEKKVYRIPEGTNHTFLILDASVTLTPEKQFIKYKLQIKSHKDWVRTKFSWLGGDPVYPKKELVMLGIDADNIALSDIEKEIGKVVGSLVKGTVKNVPGKDYQNFYFNSLVGKEEIAVVDDSDIPFSLPSEDSWDDLPD